MDASDLMDGLCNGIACSAVHLFMNSFVVLSSVQLEVDYPAIIFKFMLSKSVVRLTSHPPLAETGAGYQTILTDSKFSTFKFGNEMEI